MKRFSVTYDIMHGPCAFYAESQEDARQQAIDHLRGLTTEQLFSVDIDILERMRKVDWNSDEGHDIQAQYGESYWIHYYPSERDPEDSTAAGATFGELYKLEMGDGYTYRYQVGWYAGRGIPKVWPESGSVGPCASMEEASEQYGEDRESLVQFARRCFGVDLTFDGSGE